MRRAFLLALLGTLGLVQAQTAPLKSFLNAVRASPELAASRAALEAAELRLRAAYDPVTLEATGGYSRFDLDESSPFVQLPGGGSTGLIPESRTQLSAALTFRPFPFGDTADLVRQREVEVASSTLDYRAALAGLEGRALEAALSARLAARSVSFSREGVAAAEAALRVARTRFARGVTNARALREAEANLLQAQALFQSAQADAQLARLNLTSLVGNTPLPSVAALTSLQPPDADTPLSVRRARFPIVQAELVARSAQREIYPVVQASYTRNLSDRSSLTASIESRTLQPSVNFSYRDPGRSFLNNVTEGSFQLSVGANISLGTLATLEAEQRQIEAAQGGLQAAREGAVLQLTALESAYEAARRDVELRRLEFKNARTALRENRRRETLGLAPPLETQDALLVALQADLELRSAELAALRSLLDLNEFYALPTWETLP